MATFNLPPLSMLFPSWMNPHHDAADATSRSWFRSMGFDNLDGAMLRYESNRSCDLVARVFPDIGLLELMHLTNLVFWIPASLHQSRLYETLQYSAFDVIALVSDLIFYEKEAKYGDINNYVVVCQRLFLGAPVGDAVAFLQSLLDARTDCFLWEQRRVAAFIKCSAFLIAQREAIERYLQMLESWMSANLDWSLQAPRYNDIRTQRGDER